jgi:hypothetical protein
MTTRFTCFLITLLSISFSLFSSSSDSDNTSTETQQPFPFAYKKRSGKKRERQYDSTTVLMTGFKTKSPDSSNNSNSNSDLESEPLLDLTANDYTLIICDFMTKHAKLISEFRKTREFMRMSRVIEPYDAHTALITCHFFHATNQQLTVTDYYSKLQIEELKTSTQYPALQRDRLEASPSLPRILSSLELSDHESNSSKGSNESEQC